MRKVVCFFIFFVMSIGLICCSDEKFDNDKVKNSKKVSKKEKKDQEQWIMFRANKTRSGVIHTKGLEGTLKMKWKFKTNDKVFSSCAVYNGVVFCGSDDGFMYAIDAESGEQKWKFKTGGAIKSSPLVYKGLVFFGSEDSCFYAVNINDGSGAGFFKTSKKIWSSPTYSFIRVYIGSFDKYIHVGDARSGKKKWHIGIDGEISSSLVLDEENDLLFIKTTDEVLHAVDTGLQKKIWTRKFSEKVSEFSSSPTLYKNLVIVGSIDGSVYGVDKKTSAIQWKFKTGGAVYSSVAIKEDIAYFGSTDGKIYAIDAKWGKQIWEFPEGKVGAFRSSPAVIGDQLYIGCDDGFVYIINVKTKKFKDKIDIGSPIRSSPAVLNGSIYFGADDGYIYAYTGE